MFSQPPVANVCAICFPGPGEEKRLHDLSKSRSFSLARTFQVIWLVGVHLSMRKQVQRSDLSKVAQLCK